MERKLPAGKIEHHPEASGDKHVNNPVKTGGINPGPKPITREAKHPEISGDSKDNSVKTGGFNPGPIQLDWTPHRRRRKINFPQDFRSVF